MRSVFCVRLGTFQFLKQRPSHNLAYIHSKPVVYVNNGGGRDTYISGNSGGLRSDYRPAHGQRTFYSNLRKYDTTAQPNRNKSHTATFNDKKDVLSNTQNRFNDKFRRNAALVKNYQNMLDERLSQPKHTEQDEKGRVFRNSLTKLQKPHQEMVYRTSAQSFGKMLDRGESPEPAYAPMEQNVLSYDRLQKPRNTIDM